MDSRFRLPIVGLMVFIAIAGGCRPPIKFAPPKAPKQNRVPPTILSKGITVNWFEKQKNGTLRHLMDIEAETGTLISGKQSGVLRNAHGILYKEGKPAARFESPLVNAEEEKKIVRATGGVVAHSIDPPGVTVWADKVTWNIQGDKVVARENVRFTYLRKGDTAPYAEGGPMDQCTIDTTLKRFHIP
ncbi:MAG: hypothetical protein ABJA67_10310 [Chthonomonadales bacterium]